MGDRIKVDYATMESAQQGITSISKGIDEKLDTLRSFLQQLEWTGQDREAYDEHQAQWDQAVRDINAILNEIGGALGVAKEAYMSTEMSNAKSWQ